MSDFSAAETFTSPEILNAALNALEANTDYANLEVNVATEFDRNGFMEHRPLNNPNPSYSSSSDDLLVNVTFRIPAYRQTFDSVKELTELVKTELHNREEEALKVEIAQLKKEINLKQANIVGQQADIVRMTAQLASMQK